MGKRDYARKVWISHFLPYGIIGNRALILGQVIRPYALERYDACHSDEGAGMSMEAREKACFYDKQNGQSQIRKLRKGGFAEARSCQYKASMTNRFTANYLTQKGLRFLAGALVEQESDYPDDSDNNDLQRTGTKETGLILYPDKETFYEISLLNQSVFFKDCLGEDQAQGMLEEAIAKWVVTPLAVDMKNTLNVKNTSNFRSYQQYRAYCETNMIAMFRCAGALTCLDRRPIETGWNFTWNQKEDDVSERLDIPQFVSNALTKWYSEHPNSYLFEVPSKSLSENYDEWLKSPVFYTIHDLPNFDTAFETNGLTIRGQKHFLHHTFYGVAIGVRATYVCYTLKQKTRWNPGIESTAKRTIVSSLRSVAINETVHPYQEITCDYAILFFENAAALASLFYPTNRDKKNTRLLGSPYRAAYLVQICNAGVAQLQELLAASPYDLQKKYIRELLSASSDFEETSDPLYPVVYKKIPVYIAYLLDYRELSLVYEDYLKGDPLCICCYPEQATLLRFIMPNAQYI